MPSIIGCHAREILDSRGNPTVEVDVILEDGCFGRTAVPSGASTGENEALELRDKDKGRYLGIGVTKALNNINRIIAPELYRNDLDALNHGELDKFLIESDGPEDKSRLAANAILGVWLSARKAATQYCGLPFYEYLGGLNSKFLAAKAVVSCFGDDSFHGSLECLDPLQEFKEIEPAYIVTGPQHDKLGKTSGAQIFWNKSLDDIHDQTGTLKADGLSEWSFGVEQHYRFDGRSRSLDLVRIIEFNATFRSTQFISYKVYCIKADDQVVYSDCDGGKGHRKNESLDKDIHRYGFSMGRDSGPMGQRYVRSRTGYEKK